MNDREMDEDAHDELLDMLDQMADDDTLAPLDFNEDREAQYGGRFYEELEQTLDELVEMEVARALTAENLEEELHDSIEELEGEERRHEEAIREFLRSAGK